MINNKPIKWVRPGAALYSGSLRQLLLSAMVMAWLLPGSLFGQTEPSALLDLQSTEKGLLMPRMTQAQRDAIVTPAKGLLIYNTTTDCVDINFGTPAAPSWQALNCWQGVINALICGGAVMTGTLAAGTTASGVSALVLYAGGNGGPHGGQTVTSTGVTGLTATLAAGNFASGAGILTYTISGIPAAAGTASFALSIGGQSCALELTVPFPSCWAKVSATDTLYFMCHNLGSANTSADPFTPSWEINGGYWQWGRLGQAAPGPSGAGQPNAGAISGWNTTNAPNGSWQDGTKTGNDPCPTGYRVPTKAQWDAVANASYNPQNTVGNWFSSSTNYSAGRFFGSALMLPAAGIRDDNGGALFSRGSSGLFWSSTENGAAGAWYLDFGNNFAGVFILTSSNRRVGLSVRCASE